MYKIKIFSVGKTKEPWLQEALTDYEKRLEQILEIQWILAKNNKQLKEFLSKEAAYIALTPEAKELTSEQFSIQLYSWLTQFGCRLCFLIGGAEGIEPELLAKAFSSLSFSKLTFTHQMIRLLLTEQIYRATEIHKGSNYHK